MSWKDPYETLGVPQGTPADEIKKAYRRLVRQYHPDANPGDPRAEERFKEIQQAYETVSNPRKRESVDRQARPNASRMTASRQKARSASRGSHERGLQDLLQKFGAAKARGREQEVTEEDVARLLKHLGAGLSRKIKFDGENSTVEVNINFGKPGSGRHPDSVTNRIGKPPKPPRPPKP